MTNIMIHGYLGAMGQTVKEILSDMDVTIIPVDKLSQDPHVANHFDLNQAVDVIIDFSHYSIVDDLVAYAVKKEVPLVVCTTGLTSETDHQILEASKIIPIFKSGNMSIGINLILELARIGARVLEGFDIEIIEKHHKKKIDAPSGTALMIAEAIQSVQEDMTYKHGRSGIEPRQDKEIGIHAVRGGTITGEHILLFAGTDETIELKHQATSKRVFAKGAIDAAFYVKNKAPGLYNMTHLIKGV